MFEEDHAWEGTRCTLPADSRAFYGNANFSWLELARLHIFETWFSFSDPQLVFWICEDADVGFRRFREFRGLDQRCCRRR